MPTPAIPDDVRSYLDAAEGPRGEALRAVFETVAANMPEGYELGMLWKMPSWVVPLSTFPKTYNKLPLGYVSLASGKNYNSLYLMGLYSDGDEDRAFREAWAATGRTLDMGKSCLRFKTLADVDLGLIGDTVAAIPVDRFLQIYERIGPGSRKS